MPQGVSPKPPPDAFAAFRNLPPCQELGLRYSELPTLLFFAVRGEGTIAYREQRPGKKNGRQGVFPAWRRVQCSGDDEATPEAGA